jgi:hypothetical protein
MELNNHFLPDVLVFSGMVTLPVTDMPGGMFLLPKFPNRKQFKKHAGTMMNRRKINATFFKD